MTPRIKENDEIDLACELCGKPTMIRMKLGDIPDRVPNLLDRKQRTYRHGMCAECKKDLDEGCVIFVDSADRCMKLNLEATKEKIQREFWGKVIRIPLSAMNELIRAYLEAHPEITLPDESGKLRDGDGASAP